MQREAHVLNAHMSYTSGSQLVNKVGVILLPQ